MEERILKRSVNTDRALTMPRPRLRGWSHRVAALVAIPGAIVWLILAPPGRATVGVAAFAFGITAMFTLSALLHLRRWDAATYERLFRLDHTGIYLAIGGTGVALALLGLEGWPSQVLLVTSLAGSGFGILNEWLPYAPPKGANNAIYLTIGWTPLVLLPWLWSQAGATTVLLLLAGGVMYTTGAIIVGVRRPDPSPRWFGYHEIFHVLVIGAVATHATMFALLLERA